MQRLWAAGRNALPNGTIIRHDFARLVLEPTNVPFPSPPGDIEEDFKFLGGEAVDASEEEIVWLDLGDVQASDLVPIDVICPLSNYITKVAVRNV